MADALTKADLMELWQKQFLPSIRKEIQTECKEIMNNIREQIMKSVREVKDKCQQIERSQEFLSTKYEQMMDTTQATKKQIEITLSKVRNQDDSIGSMKKQIDDIYCQIDEMQQYTRRDCIEIIGVPKSSGEDVMEIVTEVSNLVGVQTGK